MASAEVAEDELWKFEYAETDPSQAEYALLQAGGAAVLHLRGGGDGHGTPGGMVSLIPSKLAQSVKRNNPGLFRSAERVTPGTTTAETVSTDQGLHLTWEGVTLKLPRPGRSAKKDSRREFVLHDVSGQAFPGRMLAILGPSGCGKTSLLNALIGRIPYQHQQMLIGDVTVNGSPREKFDAQRHMAYIRQRRHFYPFMTVRETLALSAGLRMGGASSREQAEYVQYLIDKLGLTQAADTLVGDEKHPGISGGEQRRLSIGCELVGLETPSIILVDEPTSGLDSSQAQKVMDALRQLCQDGHTVIVSIHQPRSGITALFDDILLMSQGQVMFHGAAPLAIPYLAQLGYHCPTNFNPADFMVDLISIDYSFKQDSDQPRPGEETVNRLAQEADKRWQKERQAILRRVEAVKAVSAQQRADGTGLVPAHVIDSRALVRRRGSSLFTQFRLLFKRSWRQATRDRFSMFARAGVGVVLGVIFGSTFWQLGLSESSITNRVSMLMNVCINTAMTGCVRSLLTFAVERPVIMTERMDEGYNPLAYFLSKLLAELPLDMTFPLIFGPIVYKMAGLAEGWQKMRGFLGMLLLEAYASSALGLFVGCLSPSSDVANLLGPAIIVVFILLGGVHQNIPSWLKQLENMSTIKWGLEGLMLNEFDGLEFQPDMDKVGGGLSLFPRALRSRLKKVTIPGLDVLQQMGISHQMLRIPMKQLVRLIGVFHLGTISYLTLRKPQFQHMQRPKKRPTGTT